MDFRIEKGEKILLQKVVSYTAEKLRINGYSHFSIEQASDSIGEQQNVFYLEVKGKYIFIESEKSQPLALKKSATIVGVSVEADATNLHQKSNCVQDEQASTINPTNNNLNSAEILRITLVNRLNKILNDPNLRIDEKLADEIRKCMNGISINFICDGQGNGSVKSARILCFCGNIYSLQWVQTKMGGH